MAAPWTGNRSNLTLLIAAAFIVLLWVIFRSGLYPPAPQHRIVTVYGYSSLDLAMNYGMFPAFRRHWQERTGEPVEFIATFTGSGEITRRVLQRYPAEVAILSSELDAAAVVSSARTRQRLPHHGVLARSPLVVVVRGGNPHGIRGLSDLVRPGLRLVQGLPASSGATNLALAATYGAAERSGADSRRAAAAVADFWSNVTIPAANARDARTRFEEGEGDALVTYEQDAIANPERDMIAGEIIHPAATLLAEPIVVPIESNITDTQRPVVEAFVEFLWSDRGQEILGEYGFRPVVPGAMISRTDQPPLEDGFTLDDLGGAVRVRRDVLDPFRNRAMLPSEATSTP